MRLRRFLSDKGGAVAVITVVAATVVIVLAAAAVDLGSVYLETRRVQGVADLAALSAARDPARAQAAVAATLTDNDPTGAMTGQAVMGQWTVKAGAAPAFTPGGGGRAARVTVRKEAPLYFAGALLGRSTLPVSRTATAANADLAALSIGTGLASLDGGAANALLSALTGSSVSLSVLDYQALAAARVDLLSYLDGLKTQANLTSNAFDDLLDLQISPPTLLKALAAQAAAAGDGRSAAALNTLAAAASGVSKIKLGQLVDLGPYARQDRVVGGSRARISVSVLELAQLILSTANNGKRLQLDLGAGYSGLAQVKAFVAIGDRGAASPWLSVTPDDQIIVRSAQARLYIQAKVTGASVLSTLGVTALDTPILVEIAPGEARIDAAECSADRARVSARSGVGRLAIGVADTSKLADFTSALTVKPATLASVLNLITITAMSDVKIGGSAWKPLSFSRADIDAGKPQRVASDDIAQATLSSLLGGTAITVAVGPLVLVPVALLQSTVASLLKAVAAPLDGILNSLTGLLGLSLGTADVRVNGLRCGVAALVS